MLDHADVKRFIDQFLPWIRTHWPTSMNTLALMGTSESTLDPIAQANVQSKGHCDQVCVSTIVKKITGLKNALFHRPNQSQTIWCEAEPRLEIYFRWFVDFQAEVEIRGLHAQSKIRIKKDIVVNGHMEGSLIVKVPWTSGLHLGHITMDLQGSPLWTLEVSETLIQEGLLRKMISSCLEASMQEASREMTKAWPVLSEALTSEQPKTDWTVQMPLERSTKKFMTCTSNEKPNLPMDGCDPCDTCCRCMIEKKCTDECKQCPCLHCNEIRWASYMPTVVATFLALSFCVQLYIINFL